MAETPHSPPTLSVARLTGLGLWNLYFVAKLALVWRGLIGFHPLENLAFALLLLLPLKASRLQQVRHWTAVPAGVALLYHDSWLPALNRVFSQAGLVSNFSPAYLLELAGRFINPQIVLLLLVLGVAYLLLQTWLRFTPTVLVVLAFLAAGGSLPGMPEDAMAHQAATAAESDNNKDKLLAAFFREEAERHVTFAKPAAGTPDFDIVFIHICSLAWDDVQALGLENHPLWKRFDLLFTRFNSASSYSGPAAIRIQRATCGQQPHDGLYSPVPANCYLMGSLQQVGFEPALAMNHDGHFDDFLKLVQAQRGMQAPPMSLTGVKVAQHAFDDSPIYDDNDLLRHWLMQRQKSNVPRAALYYNTVSLHDGNRLEGEKHSANTMATIPQRTTKLLDDLESFFQSLEASGRRTVVVLLPEHGAAYRGDKMQIAGLREIPSPAITLVPVGIKLIGPGLQRSDGQVRINAPTSYLAVSEVIARLLAGAAFTSNRFSAKTLAEGLPTTRFVAQNADTCLMEDEGSYFLKQGNSPWMPYRISPQAAP